MTAAVRSRMTASEFIAWAMAQDEGKRFELFQGEILAMAPGRSGHALVKARVWRALDDAVRAARLSCIAYPDGMPVSVDEATVYEPDALVRCGEPLDDDAMAITDPIIIVEVLSPSTQARDAGVKLADYARLPSLRHYLLVDIKTRTVVHHRIEDEAAIATAIIRDGSFTLDPPGLEIAVTTLFP